MIGVCKYCGCTEEKPCVIRIQRPSAIIGHVLAPASFPCSWLLEDVCDAPACVDRAYMDVRNSAEQLTQLLDEGPRIEFEDVA